MVTKKRGFDIASLVEDNECDNIQRKKFHSASSSEQINFNRTSIFTGHSPASSSFLPPSHHLLHLSSSNNNNNNNDQFPSAFKKVDKRETSNPSPTHLLDLSFNHGTSNASDLSLNAGQVSTALPTNASNGRPATGSLATQSLLPFLPPSLAALTFPQTNWCAKCNATFRMTSDLVYHMRSHHKPSSVSDPIRKKREEKLRCNICGETFRERHHLTRHMTSHQ